ncbi:MAG: hypothetical protein V3571_10405 [Pseudodesulfovibrio sp.]
MPDVTTPYGVLHCTRHLELSAQGAVLSCTCIQPSPIHTPLGALVPQFTTDDLRKREVPPVAFHPDGTLKSLPLEHQTAITTPAGTIPAELVTFHPDGAINRVFPLNGKLSGYWSQEDEMGLSTPVTLTTPAGPVTAKVISAGFYPDGALRSITLWPGETTTVVTPVGPLKTRIGISFSLRGRLRSVEPAEPVAVPTPAGTITAFDPDAVGVNGDVNSLLFHDDGTVARVITTLTRIKAAAPDGAVTLFEPETRESLCGDTEHEVVPMTVEFGGGVARIRTNPDLPPVTIDMARSPLFASPHLPGLAMGMPDLRCSV